MKKKVLLALGLGVAAVAAVVALIKSNSLPEDEDLWDEEDFEDEIYDEMKKIDEEEAAEEAAALETPGETFEDTTEKDEIWREKGQRHILCQALFLWLK